MKKFILLSLFLFLSLSKIFCQDSFLGEWKITSSKDEKRNSIIAIYKTEDGKYQGKIVKLPLMPDASCDACEGEEKGKPIAGMTILKELEFENGTLVNGTIMDPETAKIYFCKISYENKNSRLEVRISLDKKGRLGKTEYWTKEDDKLSKNGI